MMSEQSAVLTPPRQESRNGATTKRMDNFHFSDYDRGDFYDEMFDGDGSPRSDCEPLFRRMQTMTTDDLARRQKAADRSMVQLGITFNVYGDTQGRERIIPFDIVPRIIANEEWQWLERGLKQRITALNMFLHDIYHEQKIVHDGVVPEHVVATASGFRKQCIGLKPPRGIWCHITGTDLVRDGDGQYYVLEDNLRCPSRRVVCAAEPAADEADVPAVVRADVDHAGGRLLQPAARRAAVSARGPHPRLRRSRCCRPAASTRPISSTRSWPSRWASTWSRAATWWSPMASSTCGRPRASSGSTSSTAGSTTISSIPMRSATIRCWACPV